MGWCRKERRLGCRQFFQDVAFRLQSWDGDAVDESLWREIGGVWAGWRHGFADFVRSIAFWAICLEGTGQTIGARSG